jgi:hypothetical protein
VACPYITTDLPNSGRTQFFTFQCDSALTQARGLDFGEMKSVPSGKRRFCKRLVRSTTAANERLGRHVIPDLQS